MPILDQGERAGDAAGLCNTEEKVDGNTLMQQTAVVLAKEETMNTHRASMLAAVIAATVLGAPSHAEQITAGQNPGSASGYVTRTHQPGNRSALADGAADTFAFARLDTNRNFSISRSEADASPQLKAQFQRVDTNHDFQITPSEFSAFEIEQMKSQQQSRAVVATPSDQPQQAAPSAAAAQDAEDGKAR